jgi:hypothetical protein
MIFFLLDLSLFIFFGLPLVIYGLYFILLRFSIVNDHKGITTRLAFLSTFYHRQSDWLLETGWSWIELVGTLPFSIRCARFGDVFVSWGVE